MPKHIRVLVYEGPQEWIDKTLAKNAVQGCRFFFNGASVVELISTGWERPVEPKKLEERKDAQTS